MDISTVKAVILGHAVADALGVPVEFRTRARIALDPVTDMRGYGTYPYPAGTWSDDTSMTLCALDALACGACDFDKVMKNFVKWLDKGAFTPTGEVFDVGNACNMAILDYSVRKKSYRECGQSDELSNGNGSLMRINPFVLYLLSREGALTAENMGLIFEASALTHAHMRSKIGCGIYACVLEALIKAPEKSSVAAGLAKAKGLFAGEAEFAAYHRLFEPNFEAYTADKIRSSGYIVDSLEAAVWCLLGTGDYKSCALKAVNLGDDTDTVAAIAGGLAGGVIRLRRDTRGVARHAAKAQVHRKAVRKVRQTRKMIIEKRGFCQKSAFFRILQYTIERLCKM